MVTPKKYTEMLKRREVNAEMIGQCLYSVNKRAKNCRDKEREYRYYRRDKYHARQTYHDSKENYYAIKEELLSYMNPVCIHRARQAKKTLYFLLYQCGGYTFHQPLLETNLNKYPNLNIVDIGDFETNGCRVNELISVQFVSRVLDLVRSGNFVWVD